MVYRVSDWSGPAPWRPASQAPSGSEHILCFASLQRPDPAMMKKPQTPEELGVPVARNGSVSGLKPQNGYAPPKPPVGSPSPKLSKTPTHAPTLLEEPGKKVKKPAPPPPLSPPPRPSQGPRGAGEPGGSRGEGRGPGPWGGKASLSPSPRPLAPGTANGLGPQAGDGGSPAERRGSGGSSPERSAGSGPARNPQAPQGGSTHLCESQGTPSRGPPAQEDARLAKAKCPILSGAAPEPANTMSPPPAKKLALSAKKVGMGRPGPHVCHRGCGRGVDVSLGVRQWRGGIWPPKGPSCRGCPARAGFGGSSSDRARAAQVRRW